MGMLPVKYIESHGDCETDKIDVNLAIPALWDTTAFKTLESVSLSA